MHFIYCALVRNSTYLLLDVFFAAFLDVESFWKELDGAKLLWKNRSSLKVEDAGVAAMFGIELYAWFCLGEIVGRGFTLTGYHV